MAKAKPFDAAEYLDSPEMIAAYLTEAFESKDQALITKAIGNVARGRGVSEVAEKPASPEKTSIVHSAVRQTRVRYHHESAQSAGNKPGGSAASSGIIAARLTCA